MISLSVTKTGDGIFIDVAAGIILCCDLLPVWYIAGVYRTFSAVQNGIERNNMTVDI